MKIKKQDAEVIKAVAVKAEFRNMYSPRLKEYTLIKYVDKKEVSREKVWVDESKIFPAA